MTKTTIKTLSGATQQRIDSDNRLERKWRKQDKAKASKRGMTMAQAQVIAAQMGSDVGLLCRNGKPVFYRVDSEGNVREF